MKGIKPELFVAYALPADRDNPAVLDDVYIMNDPIGEYIYYAAADSAAVTKTTKLEQSNTSSKDPSINFCLNGERIDFSRYSVLHKVETSFEIDALEICEETIAEEQSEEYDNFVLFVKTFEVDKLTIAELLRFFRLDRSNPMGSLQIGNGTNWASYVKLSCDHNHCQFRFFNVEKDRALRITSTCNDLNYVVGDIYEHWLKLCDQYKNIPYKKFTWAEALR